MNISLNDTFDTLTSNDNNTSNYVLNTSNVISNRITNHTIDTNKIISGTLPVTRGGTGVATLTANKILVGNENNVLLPTNLHWDNTISRLGIGTTNPTAILSIFGTSATPRLILSGEEFSTTGNTSDEGIAFLCGVNRTNNRQLWIGDSANLTKNTTNGVVRIIPGTSTNSISSIATDGTTVLPLVLSGSSINLNNTLYTTSTNVNIGTSANYSTNTKLHISGSSTGYTQPLVRITQTNTVWSGNHVLETIGYTNLGGIRINGEDTGNSIYHNSVGSNIGISTKPSDGGDIILAPAGNILLTAKNNGRVGIGISTPTEIFHIQKSGADNYIKIDAGSGNANFSGIIFAEHNIYYGHSIRYSAESDALLFSFSNTTSTPSFVDRMTIQAGGNIGIGITNPSAKLQVVGGEIICNDNIKSEKSFYGTGTNSGFILTDGASAFGYASTAGAFSSSAAIGDAVLRANTSKKLILQSGSGIGHLVINTSGFIGIGTANPNINLSVGGTNSNHTMGRSIISTTPHSADNRDIFSIGRWDGANGSQEFVGMRLGVGTGASVGDTLDNHGYIMFNTWGNNISGSREVVRITSRGRVGIGLTNPTVSLDVNGAALVRGGLRIYEATGTDAGVNGQGTLVLEHGNGGGVSSITFVSAGNRTSDYAYIKYHDNTGSGENSKLRIGCQNDADDDIILEPSGNVGIKTSTPTQALHVVGNIRTTGDFISPHSYRRYLISYYDVAAGQRDWCNHTVIFPNWARPGIGGEGQDGNANRKRRIVHYNLTAIGEDETVLWRKIGSAVLTITSYAWIDSSDPGWTWTYDNSGAVYKNEPEPLSYSQGYRVTVENWFADWWY